MTDSLIRTASRIIILNDKNHVLLTRRNLNDYEGGKWCLPGGKPENNESLILAAERELSEEVGIKTNLHFFKSFKFPKFGDRVWETHYFVGKSNQLPDKFNLDEVIEVGFFNYDQIQKLNIAFGHEEVLIDFFKNIESIAKQLD
jgi:8-oxo-dGTP diphosphatase